VPPPPTFIRTEEFTRWRSSRAARDLLGNTFPHSGKFIGVEALQPSSGVLDQEAFKQCNCVCGLDESGRGTISGPLVVGAVLITPDSKLPVVYDSKQLDRAARQNLFSEIEQSGIAFVYSVVDAETIDRIGITGANALAFDLAAEACEKKAGKQADLLLIDGGKLPLKTARKIQFVTKGESVSRAIAASLHRCDCNPRAAHA